MINKKLTELIRDANREITPADRHSILDLIEQQSARITELSAKCRLYEASLDKSDREADGLRKDAGRYRKWVSYSGFTKEHCDATLDAIQINEHGAIAKEPK